MTSRVFVSMFLSSILILLSFFIPFIYLLLDEFWFYSIILVSLLMFNYSFNIIDNIETSEKGKKSLNTLSNTNINKKNVRRSTRIQKNRDREAAETLRKLSKKNI